MRPESIPGEQTYRGAVRWARRQLQGLKQLRQQPGLLELLLLLPLHRCSGSEEGQVQKRRVRRTMMVYDVHANLGLMKAVQVLLVLQ